MKTSNHARDLRHNSWETFAAEDPYRYILTSLGKQGQEAFWQSGERTVAVELLPVIRQLAVRPGVAMELGCGVGRLLFPLASHFRELVGLDIAGGMIKRAAAFAEHNSVHNTQFFRIDGPEDILQKAGGYEGSVDFFYSLLVLQHVPDFSAIEGYLHVIGHLLSPTGFAYLQFDTRPQHSAYRLKTSLPDSLLPRFWRRGIRRIRRSPADLASAIARAQLQVVEEIDPDTAYHRFVLQRIPAAKVRQ